MVKTAQISRRFVAFHLEELLLLLLVSPTKPSHPPNPRNHFSHPPPNSTQPSHLCNTTFVSPQFSQRTPHLKASAFVDLGHGGTWQIYATSSHKCYLSLHHSWSGWP